MPRNQCRVTVLHIAQPAVTYEVGYGESLERALSGILAGYTLWNRFGRAIPASLPIRGDCTFYARPLSQLRDDRVPSPGPVL
jgi:hypothetical protein